MRRIILTILLAALASFFSCAREIESPRQEASAQTAVVQKTPEQKLEAIRADIQALKVELAQAQKYSCCIQDGCNMCLLQEGSCPCQSELESGRHVCVECYSGWQQDKGAIQGITKKEVTTSFVKHEHKH
jgi:hypothetical protein